MYILYILIDNVKNVYLFDMKKHSCGAILYTISKKKVYIILGMENGEWFPFKGTREKKENNIQAAIREIHEETCGIVNIEYIDLKCNFSTKRKHYHIGLVYVALNSINQFYKRRKNILENTPFKDNDSYLEKTEINLFELDDIKNHKFHEVTRIPVQYYKEFLCKIQAS